MKITFEYIGGPHDGFVTEGVLGDGGDAERCYHFTNSGTVGYVFKVASEYLVKLLLEEGPQAAHRAGLPKHYYAVAERVDGENDVYIRAEYVANVASPKSHN